MRKGTTVWRFGVRINLAYISELTIYCFFFHVVLNLSKCGAVQQASRNTYTRVVQELSIEGTVFIFTTRLVNKQRPNEISALAGRNVACFHSILLRLLRKPVSEVETGQRISTSVINLPYCDKLIKTPMTAKGLA